MDKIDSIMESYPELIVNFVDMDENIGGYIYRNYILLDKQLSEDELIPILWEEIGHYETTVGNISSYSSINDAKQEYQARRWGIEHLVPKSAIERFKRKKYDDDFEVADELGVQVTHLHKAGEYYKLKEN